MPILVKVTNDGRKVEVIGSAICLDGRIEAFELMEVENHLLRDTIREIMPEATHIAGRIALTREEVDIVRSAFGEAEAEFLADPAAA